MAEVMTGIAADLARQLEGHVSARSPWDSLWQQVAERILPQQATFQNDTTSAASRRTDRNFDSTGALALSRFGAVLESLLTPKQKKWHSLRPASEALKRSYRVKVYLEQAREVLFAMRYAPGANFQGQTSEVYQSLGAFGTAPLLIEDDEGRGVRYRALPLAECYLTEGANGTVDGLWRKYCYTARQAAQRWKERTPAKVLQALEKDPERKFWFLHAVLPNDERIEGAPGRRGWECKTFHVLLDGKELISNGGYRVWPSPTGRYAPAGGPYGWGPGPMVLPDLKGINEMRRTLLRQGQLATDPPLLLPADAGVLSPFQTRPGALNFGMMSADGKPLAMPLQTNARLEDGRAEAEQSRRAINDSFLVTLFQILLEAGPQKTATEVLQLAQEKGVMLAPPMGKQQAEMLGPMISRELDIAAAAGLLPPMPPELAEAGGVVTVEYESELAQFQRAGEAIAVTRTLEVMLPVIQLDPGVLDNLDMDEAFRTVAEVSGMPIRLLTDPDEMAAKREARAQQAQQQAMVEAAAPVGAAAKNFAQAGQIAQAQAA